MRKSFFITIPLLLLAVLSNATAPSALHHLRRTINPVLVSCWRFQITFYIQLFLSARDWIILKPR